MYVHVVGGVPGIKSTASCIIISKHSTSELHRQFLLPSFQMIPVIIFSVLYYSYINIYIITAITVILLEERWKGRESGTERKEERRRKGGREGETERQIQETDSHRHGEHRLCFI